MEQELRSLPRPALELQRAHDVLTEIALGRVEPPDFASRRELIQRLDVLCWALGHDHNQAFNNLMRDVESHLEEVGDVLVETKQPFVLPRSALELKVLADTLEGAFGGDTPLGVKVDSNIGGQPVDGKVVAVLVQATVLWCLGFAGGPVEQFLAALKVETDRRLSELVGQGDADPK